jgi:hypothetical protein
VGALQVEKGYLAVKTWIQPLIDPNFDTNANQGSTSWSNPYSSNSYPSMGGMANPPPPASPPPPLPGNPLGQGVFLASFNQTATQRGLKIEWNAAQSGPGHALTWNVECIGKKKAPSSMIVQTLSYCPIVGGIPRGNGTGKSKQQAKEEAARQALAALGWAAGASGPYHCAFSQCFLFVKELLTRTLITHQRAVLLEGHIRLLSMYYIR